MPQDNQKLPLPPIPKHPPTPDMEKRCPGITKWYGEFHGKLEQWRTQTSKILGLTSLGN